MVSEGLLDKIRESITGDRVGIVVLDKHPWLAPTILGRISEELGIRDFVLITDMHAKPFIEDGINHVRSMDLRIIVDYHYGGHVINDNVFDTAIRFKRLIDSLDDKKIIIDLTGASGSTAASIIYVSSHELQGKTIYTVVNTIPMYGIPAYPGSPRWLHRVYVMGEDISGYDEPLVEEYPRIIEWRGTRGIYIGVAKIINSLTSCGCRETVSMGVRKHVSKGYKLEAWISSLTSSSKRAKLFSIDELGGPDEDTASMIYSAWKKIADVLEPIYQDRQSLDRMLMQLQRYVGAADLIIKESASSGWFDNVGEKLHRVLLRYVSDKTGRLALIPDTNLFYQGLNMALLKASIRSGNPWAPIRGLAIYIPRCAEAEINGKVAETDPDAGIQQRIPYTLALLANRCLLETKYYYDAKCLAATAQPCEAAIAVEAPNLNEPRILLITADRKAYTAWQTLNVCRGKVACAYIGHSDKPLGTDSIYGKFYVSIAASLLTYVASLFAPVTIHGSRGQVRLVMRHLKGSNAPVVAVHKNVPNTQYD